MEKLFINDAVYLSNDLLTWGEYGGAGSLGLANIRYLTNKLTDSVEDILFPLDRLTKGEWKPRSKTHGVGLEEYEVLSDATFAYQRAWVREDFAAEHEIFERLEEYACLDDELVSEVEREWEREAWEGWLRSDLLATLLSERDTEDEGSSLYDQANTLDAGDLVECYLAAMAETNTYPEPECSGVYIDVERIAGAFRIAIEAKLVEIAKGAWLAERIEQETFQLALVAL